MRSRWAAIALVPLLAACGTPAVAPVFKATTLQHYYQQKLSWSSCGQFQCATLTVPLDYAHPAGKTIDLSVLKVLATDPSHKVGALVVNPGGPGASGTQFAVGGAGGFFQPALTKHFDIVGFDPRGVGQSAAVN